MVGAYNGFRALGIRDEIYELPKVEHLRDLKEVKTELDKISIPKIKIILSGNGKVTMGAKEIIDQLKIREISIEDYISKEYDEAVYCLIGVEDYNKRKDGNEFNKQDFYKNPSLYESDFMKFSNTSDMFITGHFYGHDAPYLFTREDAKHSDFRINLVADVTCDVDGPVASTIRPSTIANPFYGYDPITEKETFFNAPGAITVMAVDNLPCELPNDASKGFGDTFVECVMPAFFNGDKDGILQRTQMTTSEGELTPKFEYLQKYVNTLTESV